MIGREVLIIMCKRHAIRSVMLGIIYYLTMNGRQGTRTKGKKMVT